MIKFIYGSKGTGKTKIIIDKANDSIATASGNISFLSDTDRYIPEIKRDIRFCNTKEYNIDSSEKLLSFINGMLAADYNLNLIFIDGIARMTKLDIEDLGTFFDTIEKISEKSRVNFFFTVSKDITEIPTLLKKYL